MLIQRWSWETRMDLMPRMGMLRVMTLPGKATYTYSSERKIMRRSLRHYQAPADRSPLAIHWGGMGEPLECPLVPGHHCVQRSTTPYQ